MSLFKYFMVTRSCSPFLYHIFGYYFKIMSWSFPHLWLIIGFVTKLTRRVPLVHPPVFSVIHVTRSLVLYVCFVDRCLSFFFWSLCCLFFDIRILITPLVSSSSSINGTFLQICLKKTDNWRDYDLKGFHKCKIILSSC